MLDKLFQKIGIATITTVVTALMYLWGWVYWAAYYYYSGLDYSFAEQKSFERFLLAGFYFLYTFVARFTIVVAPIIFVYVLLRRRLKRWWKSKLPARIRIRVVKILVLFRSPSARVLCMLCLAYLIVSLLISGNTYVRNDAKNDAALGSQLPVATVRINLIEGTSVKLPANSEFRVFGYRNNSYYISTKPLDGGRRRIVVIPESQIEYLELEQPEPTSG